MSEVNFESEQPQRQNAPKGSNKKEFAPLSTDNLSPQRTFCASLEPRRFVDPLIDEWRQKLQACGYQDCEWGTGGSLATGLYHGPKKSLFSLNPACPYDEIIEWDGRLFLPDTYHPHDPALITDLQRILGAENFDAEEVKVWNNHLVPITRLYAYSPLVGSTGMEIELTVLPASRWVEIADYWQRVFNSEEIEWQRDLRATLRQLGVAKGEIDGLKFSQCDECRWRIVSRYAMAALGDGRAEFPEEPPRFVNSLVARWLNGETAIIGQGLDRHPSPIPQNLVPILQEYAPDLLVAPPADPWVERAVRLQAERRS